MSVPLTFGRKRHENCRLLFHTKKERESGAETHIPLPQTLGYKLLHSLVKLLGLPLSTLIRFSNSFKVAPIFFFSVFSELVCSKFHVRLLKEFIPDIDVV